MFFEAPTSKMICHYPLDPSIFSCFSLQQCSFCPQGPRVRPLTVTVTMKSGAHGVRLGNTVYVTIKKLWTELLKVKLWLEWLGYILCWFLVGYENCTYMKKQVCMYIVCTICYTYQTSSNKSFCMGEMTAKYWVWKCNVSDKSKPRITLIWLTYLPHINSSKLFTAQNMLSTIRTCVAVFPW